MAIILTFLSARVGAICLSICNNSDDSIEKNIIIGFLILSTILISVILILKINIVNLFLIIFLLLILIDYKFKFNFNLKSYKLDYKFLVIFLFAIFISRQVILSGWEIDSSLMLNAWSDYFIHGITIASFGSPYSIYGDMEMSGAAYKFYHFIPYAFPALVQAVTGVSGLAASTLFLLPFGFFIGGLGIFSFARSLGDSHSAYLAIIFIIFAAATPFILQSGYFDFYWLIFAAPGTLYAVGISLIILELLFANKISRKNLIILLVLILSLGLTRINIFVLMVPTIILYIIYINFSKLNQKLFLILIFLFYLLIFLISNNLNKYTHVNDYLNYVSSNIFYKNNLIFFAAFNNFFQYIVISIVMLFSILKWHAFFYPLLLFFKTKIFGFKNYDVIPLLMILAFLIIVILTPAGRNGDISEFKHRHFPLLVTIVIVYTAVYISKIYFHYLKKNYDSAKILVVLLPISIYVGYVYNPATPNYELMPWSKKYFDQIISADLVSVSKFISDNSNAQDIFVLVQGIDESRDSLLDNNLSIISLSGLPSYLSRPKAIETAFKERAEMVAERRKLILELENSSSLNQIRSLVSAKKIRWVIFDKTLNTNWSNFEIDAVFTSKKYMVLDASRLN